MRTKFIVAAIFAIAVSFTHAQSVQEKILSFSQKNMKKKVDRGECWDLAAAALNNANAQWESPHDFGDKIDYRTELQPGDILQFTNVKFVFPFGSASFPKHTAIAYKTGKNSVTVFHQNFNNHRYVDTLTLYFDQIKGGTLQAYRPKAKS